MGDVTEFPGGPPPLADEPTEATVLGALLNAEDHPLDCREEVIEVLGAAGGRVFTGQAHRMIYEAFLSCLFSERSTGPQGVTAALRESGDLTEEIGKRVYEVFASAGTPVEAVRAARILRDLHRRRLTAQKMDEGARLVRSGEHSGDVAIADAFAEIARVVEDGDAPSSRYEGVRLVDEGLGVILGTRKLVPGMSYGFDDLDQRTTGIHRGHLTAVGARSGGGKTIFGVNAARHAVRKQGIPSVVFSLEMSPGDLIQRYASAELGIPHRAIQLNNLTDQQREAVRRFADAESERRDFRVEYVPGATAGELYLLARKAVRDMGAEFFVVDYAQSVQADRSVPDMNAQMAETVSRINDIATKLDVRVMLMTQLKKPQPGREADPPNVSDMLYGTKIENVATTILLLHRRHVDDGQGGSKPGYETDVHSAKNRNGTLGVEELLFDGERMRFLPAGSRLSVNLYEE